MKRYTYTILLALLSIGIFACAEEPAKKEPETAKAALEKLNITLPKPMFVGTPKQIKDVNLNPKRPKSRPPFMAPAGLKNVALEKSITGSDTEPIIGEVEQVTDGDKEGCDGSYVELGPGKQHIQIDLEESTEIHAIVLWHFHSHASVYRDVVVQLADDPDFITNVRTVFNNDNDNSAGLGVGKDFEYTETFEGKLVPVKAQKARYVRLYSNGSTSSEMNHYIEVEVYGK